MLRLGDQTRVLFPQVVQELDLDAAAHNFNQIPGVQQPTPCLVYPSLCCAAAPFAVLPLTLILALLCCPLVWKLSVCGRIFCFHSHSALPYCFMLQHS